MCNLNVSAVHILTDATEEGFMTYTVAHHQGVF